MLLWDIIGGRKGLFLRDYKGWYDHIFWEWLALMAVRTMLRSSSIIEANCSSISSVRLISLSNSCSLRYSCKISSIFLYSFMSLFWIYSLRCSLSSPNLPFQNLLIFSLDYISISLTRFLFSVFVAASR